MAVDGFVFVDIETTGLEERKEIMLEIGLALYSPKLEPIMRWSSLILDDELDNWLIDGVEQEEYEFVVNMHTKSGLLEDLNRVATMTGSGYINEHLMLENVEATAREIMAQTGVDKHTPLCGSSLRLDRNFLGVHMPKLHDMFSYRTIDASSQMEFERKFAPGKYAAAQHVLTDFQSREETGELHRVQADIHNSANTLRVLNGLAPIPFEWEVSGGVRANL